MEKIKFFGFDMDYTLAEYNSPQYEVRINNNSYNTVVLLFIKLLKYVTYFLFDRFWASNSWSSAWSPWATPTT